MLRDGLENLVAGIGTDKDKVAAFGWAVIEHSPMALEAMYRSGWLGRKIIDIPTDDMTRKWRAWSADDDFIKQVEAAEKKYAVRERVTKAKRWARLFGSSAIMIGVSPRLGKPNEPLDVAKVSTDDLLYLHVEIAPYLTIRQWNTDLLSPDFGKPEIYLYQPFKHGGGNATASVSIEVHASRVIPFCGMELPPYASLAANRWGDSVFTAIEQTLNTAGGVTAVIASLILEAKVDVIKTDLSGLATQDGEDRIKKRFGLAMMLKSINNTLLLGNGEEFDQKQINFSGLSDVHIRIMQEISGAADIPVTRLLGQTPAGLHGTGESDLRNYYDMIEAKQNAEIKPALDRLDAIMFASDGLTLPENADYRFASLWQETPQQRADNALKKAQATAAIVNTGLIADDLMTEGVVSQLIEDDIYPGLEAAVKEAKANGSPIEGDGPMGAGAAPVKGAEADATSQDD
jgi:phage-related protein (TIGR01555 family)